MLDFSNTLSSNEILELQTLAPRIAENIQNLANRKITREEKKQAEEFSRMVKDPYSRAVFMILTDQVFRLTRDASILEKFVQILRQHGIPTFFNKWDQFQLQILQRVGPFIPDFLSSPIVWVILKVMRFKTRKLILNGEPKSFHRYLLRCKNEKLKININHLGDMVLGEEEAKYHLNTYISGLRDPNISSVSVKISTLYSQVDPVAHDHTVLTVTQRLTELLQTLLEEMKETGLQKWVCLDMEEYKDLPLTIDVFKRILKNPSLRQVPLGIALQAYIPDSFSYQQKITHLAKVRVKKGGVPVRIRIVKGANMEMEKYIASLNNWAQAPYSTKQETDSNYKRMVSYAFNEQNLQAVKIGIGTHNIFEIAFSKALQSIRNLAPENFEYEMLEGVANHTRRSVQKLLGPVLIYSPVAGEEEFLNAIAYLVRRLMENTDEENFLSRSFNLVVGSKEWNEEKKKFLAALNHVPFLDFPAPRHKQNRNFKPPSKHLPTTTIDNFIPDSPTHFSLPENQVWLRRNILNRRHHQELFVPLKIGNKIIEYERKLLPCPNLSEPTQIIARFQAANSDDIKSFLRFIKESKTNSWDIDERYRNKVFEKLAVELENNRASLISCAMKTVAKGIHDLDAEISEAIDFVKYYPASVNYFSDRYPNVELKKKGTVLVISPWNFPIAIPTGGIIAALATGNRVILKPSPNSLLAAWNLVNLFWKAGVPFSALQFIPCEDKEAPLLTQSPLVDHVIFTGSAKTADNILTKRPSLGFSGETSGKNAFIITDSADKELAIKQLVESAFGYNGQKCSAASTAILTREVFEDAKFKRQLKDAVESLPLGKIFLQPQNRITPLISKPKKELLRALTQLEPQEEWLVKPKKHNLDNLWSPAVKWNVQPGSFTHLTEFFGPVLGVLKAKDLKHACFLANQTEYGLTAGLQSLDDTEIKYFIETVQAGNLYINNKITGAIVGRQPFGGIKNSRRGPGGKAGGINYVLQFFNIRDKSDPIEYSSSCTALDPIIKLWEELVEPAGLSSEIKRTLKGVKSCSQHYSNYFSKEQYLPKSQEVLGQKNIFRYRKVGNFTIRVHEKDALSDTLLRLMAGVIAGNNVSISFPESMRKHKVVEFFDSRFLQPLRNSFTQNFETDDDLQQKIQKNQLARLAYTSEGNLPDTILKTAVEFNLPVFRVKPSLEGRFLMLEQFDEQSISYTFQRYGNLGMKPFEKPSTSFLPSQLETSHS